MQGSFLCLVIFHVTREVISGHQRLLPVHPQLFFSFHIREQGVRQTAERLKHIALGKSKYLSSTVGFNTWRKLLAAFAQRMRYSLFCIQQFENARTGPGLKLLKRAAPVSLRPPGARTRVCQGSPCCTSPVCLQRTALPVLPSLLRLHGAARLPVLVTSCYLRKQECNFKAESAAKDE